MSNPSNDNDVGGTYWNLTSERRRPKREFPVTAAPPRQARKAKKTAPAKEKSNSEGDEAKAEKVEPKKDNLEVESLKPVLVSPEEAVVNESQEIILDTPQMAELEEEKVIESSGASQEEIENEETVKRPVTRQHARESGEDVWPWSGKYAAVNEESDEENFVVEEVEKASQEKTATLDGLQPPRSMNFLDPRREEAKLARKSELELLRQSRLHRTQKSPTTPHLRETTPVQLQMPIFDAPDLADDPKPSSMAVRATQTHATRHKTSAHPQEALETKKKRKRDFDADPDDYLPSFGPDFIVDDGSGYTVDPQYQQPKTPPWKLPPSKNASTASISSSRSIQTTPPAQSLRGDRLRQDLLTPIYETQAPQTKFSQSSHPTRDPTPTLSNANNVFSSEDLDTVSRTSDPMHSHSELSNPASVTTATTTFSAPTGNVPNAMSAMIVDAAPIPKLRLTVRVKDESFFISCPPDSTFIWLQQEAMNKYKQVTRMEVAFDHLETAYGARLMPNDLIREYMNDLESIVGIIKESKPLSLVTLYKSDCQMHSLPENEEIISRLSLLESSPSDAAAPGIHSTILGASVNHGIHKVLPMQGLELTLTLLPSLRGLLNLHSFSKIDFSSNALSSSAFCEALSELCKSNTLENLETMSFRDNLLGLGLETEPIKTLFSKFTGLTSLDISENMLNDRAIGALVTHISSNIPSLTDLNLSSNFFGLQAIQTILKANVNLSALKKLSIARNPLGQEAFCLLIRSLSENSALESLDASYTDVFAENDSNGVQSIDALQIPPLEEAIELIGSKFTKIQSLALRGCKIDTQASPMLLPLLCLTLKRCSIIDLADCGLTAPDLKFLRTLLQSPHLSSLDLSFNNFASTTKYVLTLVQTTQGRQQQLSIKFKCCHIPPPELVELEKIRTLAAYVNIDLDLNGN